MALVNEKVRDIINQAWKDTLFSNDDRPVGEIMLDCADRVIEQVQALRAPVQVPHPEGYVTIRLGEYDQLKMDIRKLVDANEKLGAQVSELAMNSIGRKILPDGWEQLRGENMGEQCQISYIVEGQRMTTTADTLEEAFRNVWKKPVRTGG